MKLSEAIRAGAGMTGQCFWRPVEDKNTCALGAAAVGYLGKEALDPVRASRFIYVEAREVWPILDFAQVPPCGCKLERGVVKTIVPHLNDSHHWTREAIAEWTETAEARFEAMARIGGADAREAGKLAHKV